MSNIKFDSKEEVKRFAFNKIYFALVEAEEILKREKVKYKKKLEEKENKISLELEIY